MVTGNIDHFIQENLSNIKKNITISIDNNTRDMVEKVLEGGQKQIDGMKLRLEKIGISEDELKVLLSSFMNALNDDIIRIIERGEQSKKIFK